MNIPPPSVSEVIKSGKWGTKGFLFLLLTFGATIYTVIVLFRLYGVSSGHYVEPSVWLDWPVMLFWR